jgi:hypothetical protein
MMVSDEFGFGLFPVSIAMSMNIDKFSSGLDLALIRFSLVRPVMVPEIVNNL